MNALPAFPEHESGPLPGRDVAVYNARCRQDQQDGASVHRISHERFLMTPRVQIALDQICAARQYTLQTIADIDDDQWFHVPQGVTTHVAWQVGHLAMAEYGLALFRQRGRLPVDSELMSSAFRKKFSRGSQPESDPAAYPAVEEIRHVLDRVHQQVQQELPEFDEAALDAAVEAPYAAYANRFGALLFCAHHEMLHAGQIGLLRRMMGKPVLR